MLNYPQSICLCLGIALVFAPPVAAQGHDLAAWGTVDNLDIHDDLSLGQGVGATIFRDVDPTDWAFQSLDDLTQRYNCLVGYPDGTFRGDQPLLRAEFAAGLNACFQQVEQLLPATTADFATRDDLDALTRQMQELQGELGNVGDRVDALDGRVTGDSD